MNTQWQSSFADQQAIRYAAFCSTMTLNQVIAAMVAFHKCSDGEAAQKVLALLDADDLPKLNGQPRIILAAGSLDDEELTSTVLWLRSFGVDITCVEMKPYRLPDSGTLVLVPRVIIPRGRWGGARVGARNARGGAVHNRSFTVVGGQLLAAC